MNYVIACLMHEMLKHKDKEPQGEDAALVLRQSKGDKSFLCQGAKLYFCCGRPGHIAHFFYKIKNKEQKQTKNARDGDDYAFVMCNETRSNKMCKWIIYLGASKHTTLHIITFDTYEVMTPRNVHLGSHNVFQTI